MWFCKALTGHCSSESLHQTPRSHRCAPYTHQSMESSRPPLAIGFLFPRSGKMLGAQKAWIGVFEAVNILLLA